jgi:hypothetical protein
MALLILFALQQFNIHRFCVVVSYFLSPKQALSRWPWLQIGHLFLISSIQWKSLVSLQFVVLVRSFGKPFIHIHVNYNLRDTVQTRNSLIKFIDTWGRLSWNYPFLSVVVFRRLLAWPSLLLLRELYYINLFFFFFLISDLF